MLLGSPVSAPRHRRGGGQPRCGTSYRSGPPTSTEARSRASRRYHSNLELACGWTATGPSRASLTLGDLARGEANAARGSVDKYPLAGLGVGAANEALVRGGVGAGVSGV